MSVALVILFINHLDKMEQKKLQSRPITSNGFTAEAATKDIA
jgi:hypothetical protein